jgi:nicotinate-nucleotide adenylyltransferase
MRKVAILGGTFDPVHWGHLLIAETALNQVALEQVIWVPARCPPHKQAALFEHRLDMVQRAIADHPAFAVSPSSANRSYPSYAIQTLTDLQAVYPNTHWYWIVGLDAFRTLPRWYRRQELASACHWLVAPRFLSPTPLVAEATGITAQVKLICEQVGQQLADENITIHWQILQMPWVGVSSSLIRQYCRNRSSIRYLVPEAVRIYIAIHNLYSD